MPRQFVISRYFKLLYISTTALIKSEYETQDEIDKKQTKQDTKREGKSPIYSKISRTEMSPQGVEDLGVIGMMGFEWPCRM
jgi:hypothetical protein